MKNRRFVLVVSALLCLATSFLFVGCSKKTDAAVAADTGPHPATVEPDMDSSNFKVDHPDQFPIATASAYVASSEINVTGVVSPDVSRQVPVPSLATGRVVEIDARLGDQVTKGQTLFKVRSTDISGAYSNYLQAEKNEQLTKIQLERANILFDHGATPKSAVEIAQNAEDDNIVQLNAAKEQLGLLGVDPKNPSAIVSFAAPISGIITDQQITNQAGVQALATPSPFTISDMSRVWIICDVYENDLPQVHVGEVTDVHLNAYPNDVLAAKVGNIAPIMDPTLHTAKVRLELPNKSTMRLGMFATATFHGQQKETHASVPAAAVLHLHDRDWVYSPNGSGIFKRIEVKAGNMLAGNMQEIISGVEPGAKIVSNALVLQNTVEQ